jgi:hypothetical protein
VASLETGAIEARPAREHEAVEEMQPKRKSLVLHSIYEVLKLR